MSESDLDPAVASDVDFVPLAAIGEPTVLPQIHALLDDAGIAYVVMNEGVQNLLGLGASVFGWNPATGVPLLCVDPAKLDEARELLAPLFSPPAEPVAVEPAPRQCPACGEPLESEPGDVPLANCYHCGAALGSAPSA